MGILTKTYRVVANSSRIIILKGEYNGTTETIQPYAAEFDTESEMNQYIIDNNLIE